MKRPLPARFPQGPADAGREDGEGDGERGRGGIFAKPSASATKIFKPMNTSSTASAYFALLAVQDAKVERQQRGYDPDEGQPHPQGRA